MLQKVHRWKEANMPLLPRESRSEADVPNAVGEAAHDVRPAARLGEIQLGRQDKDLNSWLLQVRWLVCWQPVILLLVQGINWSLGLE